MSPSELVDYRVVTVDGYAVETWLDENLPGVEYISVPTALNALRMVDNGTADVYLDPLATADYLARQNDLAELQSAGPLGDDYALSIAYTEGDQILGSIMQKLIDSIVDSEARIIIDRTIDPPSFTAAEQTWLDLHSTITVAYDPSWPPYEYVDGLGHLAGLSGAYASMFTAMTGSDFATAENIRSWGDALGHMRAGTADVMFVIEDTAERDTYMDFTDAWMHIDIEILTLADTPAKMCR
ncbi:MAG: transporter substrate-binding domain-containing protein [Thaumarchaeota archaeon]|nr:transporter substrate-binding domain-containing protein [Nitrososphaerota archaeon]